MAEKFFTLSALPIPVRVILYKTTTPAIPSYSQDAPASAVPQPIAFLNIDDVNYSVLVYELLPGNILGQVIWNEVSKSKQKDFQQELNLQIVADTDMISGQNIYDGSATYPAYNGLVVNIDYYVERQNQGTFNEVTDVPPFGFRLNNDIDGNPVNFNPLEKFTIHFYPKVKITQTVQSGSASNENIIEVTADTVADASFINSLVDINSATNKIRIELDYLANFPDGAYIKFQTNRGNQINAIIAGKPAEEILYNQATAFGYGNVAPVANTDMVMGNNEYLKLSKKGGLWYVDYFTGSYDDVGDVILGTRLKHNCLLADGAAGSPTPNELDPTVYVRLYRELLLMSGVHTSKADWEADKTKFYNDAVLGKIGIPDLRGYSPRFLDMGAGINTDRVAAGTHNTVLSVEDDAIKSHNIPINQGNSYTGSGGPGVVGRGSNAPNTFNLNYVGSTETHGKDVAFFAFIKI